MDRDRLKGYLDEGLSLEQIGALEDRDPSTVGYWLKKHGLRASGAEKFAPRGGLAREDLKQLIARGLTIGEIAAAVDRNPSTVNYWLRRYGLRTQRAHGRSELVRQALAAGQTRVVAECPRHGTAEFLIFANGRSRCGKCNSEAVQRRRERVKRMLVQEAGGRCRLCGYDRYPGALQFHHLDRAEKAFGISRRGVTRSLERSRVEARKCLLLCANCHAEVEAGVASVS